MIEDTNVPQKWIDPVKRIVFRCQIEFSNTFQNKQKSHKLQNTNFPYNKIHKRMSGLNDNELECLIQFFLTKNNKFY